MSLYLPERKGNDSWNSQEHNKNERGFPIFFFFFCLWRLAVQKATLGFMYVPASALNRQSIDRAPLGADIEGKKACPK